MRQINVHDMDDERTFAEKAAKCFAANPKCYSFSDPRELTAGGYLALRWGMGEDCVVVVKLDEYHEPVNYVQLVKARE